MPNIYKSWTQLTLKIMVYDQAKQRMMPFDSSKYSGFNYFWRTAAAAIFCMGLSTVFTYPLDLIHTRICSDFNKKGA